MNELIMEKSDKIITELSLCGYIVKEEVIPWIDHIHRRISVEDLFDKEHNLTVAENITYTRIKEPEIPYMLISRDILFRKLIREIMKREWPMERRVLGNWGIDK